MAFPPTPSPNHAGEPKNLVLPKSRRRRLRVVCGWGRVRRMHPHLAGPQSTFLLPGLDASRSTRFLVPEETLSLPRSGGGLKGGAEDFPVKEKFNWSHSDE